jgi:tRNA A37 threonylcarbamoyladenosine dehydratase
MRMHAFHRNELLLGRDAYARLVDADVCVIGLGGVGSYAAEAMARAGVGRLTLVDFDKVCLTNLNRQLHATRETVGQSKAALMGERARAISPKIEVRVVERFYDASSSDEILDRDYDAVLDCIDSVTSKLHLLEACVRREIPAFSSMGAGGRLDPTRIQVSDLADTRNDPLARAIRGGLRERGIERGVTAVWTDELPQDLDPVVDEAFVCICPDKANSPFSCDRRHQVQGTVPWMPPMFGLALAGAAVHALVGRALSKAPAPKAPRMAPSTRRPSAERRRALLDAAGLTIASRRDFEADGA